MLKKNQLLLSLFLFLNILNFVDRQLLASFANFIVPDLNLTNTEFGLLTGLVFLFFYSIIGIFMGYLADRLNRIRLISFGVFLWSLLTAASGLAKGFFSLAIPRAFIGIGESILTPTALSVLADVFDKKKMGLITGIYYMGVPIGIGLSLLIAGYLGPLLGWRLCFFILGFLGVVCSALILCFKEPKRLYSQKKENTKSFIEIITIVFKSLKASPALCFTILGVVLYHVLLGAAVFEQLWLVEERGFEKAHIAQISGYIALFGGVLGNLVGGLVSDWYLKKTGQGRPMMLCFLFVLLLPLGILYRLISPDTLLFYALMFLALFQLGFIFGPSFSTVQELAPGSIRATIIAFYIFCINIIGVGVGVTLAGILVDLFIFYGIDEPYTLMFIVTSLIPLFSIPCFYIAGKCYKLDIKNKLV